MPRPFKRVRSVVVWRPGGVAARWNVFCTRATLKDSLKNLEHKMNAQNAKPHDSLKWTGVLVTGLTLLAANRAGAGGNWLKLANTAPDSIAFMLLLSDGTVLAANNPHDIDGDIGKDWYRLTPDPNGHYVNGEWSTDSTMIYARQAYASQVLTNGMVLVAGGEHPDGGAGGASAEIYNPLNHSWALVNPPTSMMDGTQISPQGFNPPLNQGFLDSESTLLPNGTSCCAGGAQCYQWQFDLQSWRQRLGSGNNQCELAGGSVMGQAAGRQYFDD